MRKHVMSVDPVDERYSLVLCPQCGFDYVHLDEVYVAARAREDGEINGIQVTASGQVRQGYEVQVPMGELGSGRRHTISLGGWCEGCGQRVAFAFQQHKGQTHLSTLAQTWTPTRGVTACPNCSSPNILPVDHSPTKPLVFGCSQCGQRFESNGADGSLRPV